MRVFVMCNIASKIGATLKEYPLFESDKFFSLRAASMVKKAKYFMFVDIKSFLHITHVTQMRNMQMCDTPTVNVQKGSTFAQLSDFFKNLTNLEEKFMVAQIWTSC